MNRLLSAFDPIWDSDTDRGASPSSCVVLKIQLIFGEGGVRGGIVGCVRGYLTCLGILFMIFNFNSISTFVILIHSRSDKGAFLDRWSSLHG